MCTNNSLPRSRLLTNYYTGIQMDTIVWGGRMDEGTYPNSTRYLEGEVSTTIWFLRSHNHCPTYHLSWGLCCWCIYFGGGRSHANPYSSWTTPTTNQRTHSDRVSYTVSWMKLSSPSRRRGTSCARWLKLCCSLSHNHHGMSCRSIKWNQFGTRCAPRCMLISSI